MSLVLRRMELERAQNAGWLFVALGVIQGLTSASGWFSVDDSVWSKLFPIGAGIVALVFIVYGIERLRSARAALRRFEADHGQDAGKQKPV
jgi:hypothetical protein